MANVRGYTYTRRGIVGLLAGLLAAGVLIAVGAAATAPVPLVNGPAPPYTVRVDMLGCHVTKSITVVHGKGVLFVNAGTAGRYVNSGQVAMPQWLLKKGMWFETNSDGATTFKVTAHHVGCAYTDVYTVVVT